MVSDGAFGQLQGEPGSSASPWRPWRETVGEIATFVGDIEKIGEEIKLIALNAQIKSAYTGDEGAALGVLAEAIQRLSIDAIDHTGAVSAYLAGDHRGDRRVSTRGWAPRPRGWKARCTAWCRRFPGFCRRATGR